MEEMIHLCDFGRKPCRERVPNDKPFVIAFEGAEYSADLCQKHQDNLRRDLSVYMEIARPLRNQNGRAVHRAGDQQYTTKDVRTWAIAQGLEVAGSGRLPNELHERYKQAHGLG